MRGGGGLRLVAAVIDGPPTRGDIRRVSEAARGLELRRIARAVWIVGCGFSLAAQAQTYVVRTVDTAALQDTRKIDGVAWSCKGDTCRTAVNSVRIPTVDHCRKLTAVVGAVRSFERTIGSPRPALTAAQIAECNAPVPARPAVVPGVKLPPEGTRPDSLRQVPPATPSPASGSAGSQKPATTVASKGLEIRTPLLTVSGAAPAALPAFKAMSFTTAPLTVTGAAPAALPPFKPMTFRTPTLTISGAP